MTDLTYSAYNKKSLLVRGDREKYGNKLKEVGGRWNTRVKDGPGWTVPSEKESELKKLIASLKKEEKIEVMSSHAKSNREQKKYHRAVSESEESEEKSYDSEREKESERESERESHRVKPIVPFSSRRSEKINSIIESSPRKENGAGGHTEVSKEGGRSRRDRPVYSSESESDEEPRHEIKPIEKHGRSHRDRSYSPEPRHKIPERKPVPDHRHKSPERKPVPEPGREGRRKDRSPPRKKRSPSLTSESESDYSSYEDDFPSPHTPVKRKTREELERDLRRKVKDLERKVEEMRVEKRRYRR